MLPDGFLTLALGFALSLIAQKLGLKVPGMDQADKPFVDCLAHLQKVKAGEVKLDDLDKEVLRSIKPLIEEIVK